MLFSDIPKIHVFGNSLKHSFSDFRIFGIFVKKRFSDFRIFGMSVKKKLIFGFSDFWIVGFRPTSTPNSPPKSYFRLREIVCLRRPQRGLLVGCIIFIYIIYSIYIYIYATTANLHAQIFMPFDLQWYTPCV